MVAEMAGAGHVAPLPGHAFIAPLRPVMRLKNRNETYEQ
jgi:hypothetical protein